MDDVRYGDSRLDTDSTVRPVRALAAQPVRGRVPGRRTITITGHGAERTGARALESRRRPPTRVYERAGFQPDRFAMWAVVLGILLIFVAAMSSHI